MLVEDVETARAAVAGGATVVQLRRKGASTDELVEAARPFRELGATFVVNILPEGGKALVAHFGKGFGSHARGVGSHIGDQTN